MDENSTQHEQEYFQTTFQNITQGQTHTANLYESSTRPDLKQAQEIQPILLQMKNISYHIAVTYAIKKLKVLLV